MKKALFFVTALLCLTLVASVCITYAAWENVQRNRTNTIEIGNIDISIDQDETSATKYFEASLLPRDAAFSPVSYADAVSQAATDNGETIAEAKIRISRTTERLVKYSFALDDSEYSNNAQVKNAVALTCYTVQGTEGSLTAWNNTSFAEADPIVGFIGAETVTYHLFLTVVGNFAADKAFEFDLTVTSTVAKQIVSFDSDGGSTVGPIDVDRGQTLAPPTIPAKSGHIFDNWYKVENAVVSGTAFDFATPIDENMTLKAKWIALSGLTAVDSQTNLIDRVDGATYDLSELYSNMSALFAHEANFEANWYITGRDGIKATLTDELLPTGDYNGVYTVELAVTPYGAATETAMYTGKIDVYDSENPDYLIAETNALGMKGLPGYTYQSSMTLTVDYITDATKGKIMRISGLPVALEAGGIAVNPLHSSAYYTLLGEGDISAYSVQFSYKLISTTSAVGSTRFATGVNTQSGWTNPPVNAWNTKTIDLSTLCQIADAYKDTYSDGGKTSGITTWLMQFSKGNITSVLISELILVPSGAGIASGDIVTDSTVHLIDSHAVSSYDYTLLYTEDMTAYESLYDFSWRIIGRDGGATVLGGSNLVTSEYNGLYTLKRIAALRGTTYETAVYTGTLDFYDSTSVDLLVAGADVAGMTALKAFRDELKSTAAELAFEFVEYETRDVMRVTMGGSSTRAGISINALHSAEYYALLGDQYTVQYSYKVISSSVSNWMEFQNGSGATGSTNAPATGAWNTYTVALPAFAAGIGNMRDYYEKSLSGEILSAAIMSNTSPLSNWLMRENVEVFCITELILVPVGG